MRKFSDQWQSLVRMNIIIILLRIYHRAGYWFGIKLCFMFWGIKCMAHAKIVFLSLALLFRLPFFAISKMNKISMHRFPGKTTKRNEMKIIFPNHDSNNQHKVHKNDKFKIVFFELLHCNALNSIKGHKLIAAWHFFSDMLWMGRKFINSNAACAGMGKRAYIYHFSV